MDSAKIRKLAEKAGMVEVLYSPGFPDIRYPDNMDKFAELIVQECISVFNYDPTGAASSSNEWFVNNRAVKMLRNHFGIE